MALGMRWQQPTSLAIRTCMTTAALALCVSAYAADLPSDADRYMQAMADLRHFTGVAVIARDGKVLSARGYGYADLDKKTPNTLRTRFRLGSMTKQFTSMAIMQLRDAGKLDLGDSVCKYADGCPETWKPITLRQLLNHSSGIANYTDFPELDKWKRSGATPGEIIAVVKTKPLDFAPGEKMAYSNSGYILLGRVIEKVSGQTYADFVRDHIFKPLGMNDSGYETASARTKDFAAGYELKEHKLAPAEPLDMSVPYAAGSLYSTAEDLIKWDAALYTDKLLSAKSRAEMFTPGKGDAAFGWFATSDKNGRKTLAHDGAINGFASYIARYPESKTLVLILSNLQNTNVDAVDLNLAAIAFGEPYELPKKHVAVAAKPGALKAYAGEYKLPWGTTLLVTTDSEHLYVGGNGRPKVQLITEADPQFYLEEIDTEIRFLRDPSGKVTDVMFGEAKAPRLK